MKSYFMDLISFLVIYYMNFGVTIFPLENMQPCVYLYIMSPFIIQLLFNHSNIILSIKQNLFLTRLFIRERISWSFSLWTHRQIPHLLKSYADPTISNYKSYLPLYIHLTFQDSVEVFMSTLFFRRNNSCYV